LGGAIFWGLLLFSACVTRSSQLGYEDWQRSGASESDFAADRAECLSAATVPMSVRAASGNVLRTEIDDDAYLRCMRGRKWELR
jgi:hypothetical protein